MKERNLYLIVFENIRHVNIIKEYFLFVV